MTCAPGLLLCAGICRTPRILFRVVCGFGLTMASFCPTKALSNVDFPTFGRPRMQTNPE